MGEIHVSDSLLLHVTCFFNVFFFILVNTAHFVAQIQQAKCVPVLSVSCANLTFPQCNQLGSGGKMFRAAQNLHCLNWRDQLKGHDYKRRPIQVSEQSGDNNSNNNGLNHFVK